MVADIGLRISEGISDLKLDQQLAPAREAVSRTFTAGSTNFFKAVEGVRGRWLQRNGSTNSTTSDGDTDRPGSPQSQLGHAPSSSSSMDMSASRDSISSMHTKPLVNGLRPLNISMNRSPSLPEPMKPVLGGWGTGISSFFAQRAPRMSTTTNFSSPGSRRTSVDVASRTSSPARPEKVAPITPSASGLNANVSEDDKENNALDDGHRMSEDDLAASDSRQSVQSAGVGYAI